MRNIYKKLNGELVEIQKGQEYLIQDDWVKLTEAEVEAVINPPKTEEQIFSEKWQIVNEYLANDIPNIENTSASGATHTFIVKSGSMEEIEKIANSKIISDNHKYDWIQVGIPTYVVTKGELSIIYLKWEELRQNKIKEVFGIGV